MNKRRIVGLIPARGGSKGIVGKNLVSLGTTPLIHYTIEAAKAVLGFESVYVSSDDEKILEFSDKSGVKTIRRPDYLATDDASSDVVVRHAIDALELADTNVIALLQPTSPLRTGEHLSQALLVMSQNNYLPVISVNELAGKYHKLLAVQNGRMIAAIKDEFTSNRRQDVGQFYQENGAIYLFTVRDFCKGNDWIPRTGTFPYVMSEQSSIDIDSIIDLQHAEEALEYGLSRV